MSGYKLSRCPFCESTNAALVEFQCGDVWVECQDCGAVGPTADIVLEMPDRKAEAIALWNKRPVEAELLAACEAVLALAEKNDDPEMSEERLEQMAQDAADRIRAAIAKAKGEEANRGTV